MLAQDKQVVQWAELYVKNRANLECTSQFIDRIFPDHHSWTMRQIDLLFSSPPVHFYFLYEGLEIIGILVCSQLFGEVEIFLVGIIEEKRQSGYGYRFMKSYLDSISYQDVYLELRSKNKAALSLYKKLGFELVHCRKNYYRQPSDHALIMKKKKEENNEHKDFSN